MTVAQWLPGTPYLEGDIVRPVVRPTPPSTALVNPDFASGSTGWTLGTGFALATDKYFTGTQSVKHVGTGTSTVRQSGAVDVAPGTSITARCMYLQGAADAGDNTGNVTLTWLDAGAVEISTVNGNVITSSSNGWQQSSVTAIAPSTAASVVLGGKSIKTANRDVWFDAFTWDYASQTTASSLIYTAVQTGPGISGSVEPIWPLILGNTVVDNTVTWEAVNSTRLVWTATPILQSDTYEPVWPEVVDEYVSDGSVSWQTVVRNVKDTKCPNTKVVLIGANKIFAADEDIIAFSATANPLDWSTANDAGYLPTGLQQYGANRMAAMGLYRGNLVAWNSQGSQVWQIDEDPQRMALLDALPIGCTQPKSVAPVSNDLLFLTELGVRSVGIAGGAENLQAGDLGAPIDPLIRAAVVEANALEPPLLGLATYVPAAGQFWLTFGDTAAEPLLITGTLPDIEEDHSYSNRLQIEGGTAPYTNAQIVSGAMPTYATLTIDGDEILVEWPSDAVCAIYTFVVQIEDTDGRMARSYQTPRVISTLSISGTLPDTVAGATYSENLPITGGVQPYVSATIQTGALPTGGTVTIAGTNCVVAWPNTAPAGDYTFSIAIEDSNECSVVTTQTPSIAEFPEVWWLVTNYTAIIDGTTQSSKLWKSTNPISWPNSPVQRLPLGAEPPEAADFLGQHALVFCQSGQAEEYANLAPASPQVGTVISLASPEGFSQTVVNRAALASFDIAYTPGWVTYDGGDTFDTIASPTGGDAVGDIFGIVARNDGRFLCSMAVDIGGEYHLWYSDDPSPGAADWTDLGAIGSPNWSVLFFLTDGINIIGFCNFAQGMLRADADTANTTWANESYPSIPANPRCGDVRSGTFVVGTGGGTSSKIIRSADSGNTWAIVETGTAVGGLLSNDVQNLHYGGGYWIASCGDGTTVVSSDDGVTWAAATMPNSNGNLPWLPFFVGDT